MIDFYLADRELSLIEQDDIEDFYENWTPGKVMKIHHVPGQVKGTESKMTISKEAIKELGKNGGKKYRIQNALNDSCCSFLKRDVESHLNQN